MDEAAAVGSTDDTHLIDHNSLRVIIDSPFDCYYEFKIEKLYGKVQSVKITAGAKRLTIQLHKQYDKDKAWPHPHQSKTKLS